MKAKEATQTVAPKSIAAKTKAVAKKLPPKKTKQGAGTVKKAMSKPGSSKVVKTTAVKAKVSKSHGTVNVKSRASNQAVVPSKGTGGDLRQAELPVKFKNRLLALDSKCQDSRAYENIIRDLDCNAKIKRVLLSIVKAVTTIGGKVVKIGKIVFDFALKIWKEMHHHFPNLSVAILIGLILQVVVFSIPYIGFILVPLLQPLFLVTMVSVGVALDVIDKVKPFLFSYFNINGDSDGTWRTR